MRFPNVRQLSSITLVGLALVLAPDPVNGGDTRPEPSGRDIASGATPSILHNRRPNVRRGFTPGSSAFPKVRVDENGLLCTVIDFEGVGNLSPIPEFDGITSPDWLAIIDGDAGGSGNIANEPSPETVAFWLGGPDGTGSSRDIVFADPAVVVEFFYASAVTTVLTGFDAGGNVVASTGGPPNLNAGPGGDPTGDYDQWDPLRLDAGENQIARITVSGAINQTAIDNLNVCRRTQIHSIEITQAIQQWQTLEEFEAELANDREPPVPIVSGKPAAFRIYFDPVQTTTQLGLELDVPGITGESRSVTLQPGCSPEDCRRLRNGCRSVDFYFTPPSGDWTVNLTLLDDQGMETARIELPLHSRTAEPLVLAAVEICDARNAAGTWQCAANYHTRLQVLASFLRSVTPTHSVRVVDSRDSVRLEIDADHNGTVNAAESDQWWAGVAEDVDDRFTIFDGLRDLLGFEDRRYYGMIRANLNDSSGTIGIAHWPPPQRGAISLSSASLFGTDVSAQAVAHETFHTMGRRHTNTSVPSGTTAPACALGPDPGTDWPFPDNRLRFGSAAMNSLEVGFDVARRRVLQPEVNFDVMGYCAPMWISAHTYTRLLEDALKSQGSEARPRALSEGAFWVVAGRILGDTVEFKPLVRIDTAGPTDAGSGTHRVDVVDSAGEVLFSRQFTPIEARSLTTGSELVTPPFFSELIPVQPEAEAVHVVGPGEQRIGDLAVSGVGPMVTVVFPDSGAVVAGPAEISWTSSSPSGSATLTHWVQYSPEAGALGSWTTLATGLAGDVLAVDFGELPGSEGLGLVRVIASDGARSAAALSPLFSVPKKDPIVEILMPRDEEVLSRGELVWLQAAVRDAEDGLLEGGSVRWDSDRDGTLGEGTSVPVTNLTEGTHTITVAAEDSDGNSAEQSLRVTVAGDPPTVSLSVIPRDTLPTTCVDVTIDAEPGSVALETVEYSLDAGLTWIDIPASRLPFSFVVPGSGFFQLVVRARDQAGQLAAADERFFVDTPCADTDDCGVDAKGDPSCDDSSCSIFDIVAAIDQAVGRLDFSCEADVVGCDGTVNIFDVNCLIDCALSRPGHCLTEPCTGGGLAAGCPTAKDRAGVTPSPQGRQSVALRLKRVRGGQELRLRGKDLRIRAAFLELHVPLGEQVAVRRPEGLPSSIEVHSHRDGNRLRVVLVSMGDERVDREALLRLGSGTEQGLSSETRVLRAEMIDDSGRTLEVVLPQAYP